MLSQCSSEERVHSQHLTNISDSSKYIQLADACMCAITHSNAHEYQCLNVATDTLHTLRWLSLGLNFIWSGS
jgi:hypothetical protein